jgi:hypothetical protein
MFNKIFFCIMITGLVASCNNAGDDKSKTQDSTTTTTTHDGMEHPATTGDIPVLPQIPKGARVEFKNLKQGETISMPFTLEMGTEGIRIDTAGPVVAGSGHHHLFIDAEDSLAAGTIVPKDSLHLHFGKGQTSYELNLPPGKHKLTLQYADGLHRSYGSQLSASISVNVVQR